MQEKYKRVHQDGAEGEMLATQPDFLNLIPETHTVVREN